MHWAHHAGNWAGLGGAGVTSHWVTHEWTLTYLGDEWRWDSEPYGEVVSVGWAWRRELKDAGEELPEAVNSEDGDSGLLSQELHGGHAALPPHPHRKEEAADRGSYRGQAVWWPLNGTNTARWRRDRDGGKGGQTGRVGTEVTDLDQ